MLPKPVVGWHCDFVFQHAPIGIALVDINGHILRGNDAFAAMIGLPLVQAEGLHFRAFTHPDDLSADLDLFNAVLAGERDGYTIEKRYLRSRDLAIASWQLTAMASKRSTPAMATRWETPYWKRPPDG
ncbi:PAS domain S-box protein [Brucella pseudogrignonensis]|uniref:PAS domain S-box protein n=1 Tax=Brucella pseudogrignonensis TaxID=419475 RepID=UPI003ECEAA59